MAYAGMLPADLVCMMCHDVPGAGDDLVLCGAAANAAAGPAAAHKICGACYLLVLDDAGKKDKDAECPVCRVAWVGSSIPKPDAGVSARLGVLWKCQVPGCGLECNPEAMAAHLEWHNAQGEACQLECKGCTERDYAFKPRHICLFAPAMCEFCGTVVAERRELLQHQAAVGCGDIMEACGLCGDFQMKRLMKQHLEEDCVMAEEPCRVCKTPVARIAFPVHNALSCPERVVMCPANIGGCMWKGKAKDVETHMAQNAQQHIGCALSTQAHLPNIIKQLSLKRDAMLWSVAKVEEFLQKQGSV